MDIKDILLFLRPGEPFAPVLSAAASLAKAHGAFVQGCCLMPEPPLDPADCYAIGPKAAGGVLLEIDRAAEAISAPAEAAFRQAILDKGIAGDWALSVLGEPAAATILRARTADIAIMRRPSRGHGGELAEILLMSGGAPCLFVPDAAPEPGRFDRIVLAWNGSRQSKRALDEGLTLMKSASAVQVVSVGATAWAASACGPDAVLTHLGRHGVKAEAKRAPASSSGDVADALIAACDAFGADLLVMGAYGHARAAEAVLGGATRALLSRGRAPVLMSR